MDVTKVDKNQVAGLQAACDAFNKVAKETFAPPEDNPNSTYTDSTLQEYWDKCYADVKSEDETEEEVFARATESYQKQHDVGLGTDGIKELEVKRAEEASAVHDDGNALALKQRKLVDEEAAAVKSAALIAAGK